MTRYLPRGSWVSACVLLAGWSTAAQAAPAKPAVLLVTHSHDALRPSFDYIRMLDKAGFALGRTSPENVTPKLLAKYNVVALFGVPIYEPKNVETPEMKRFISVVADFARGGGGVLFAAYASESEGYGLANSLMAEAFGGRLLWEAIHDSATETDLHVTGYQIRFAYTQELDPEHPITQGLKGLWYPTRYFARQNHGTLPWLVDKPWRIVVKGGPDSRTEPILYQVPRFKKAARATGYDAYVPIMVSREFGKGRVVMYGVNPMYHLMGGHQPGLRRIVADRGYGGRPSDGDKLIVRSLKWLVGSRPPAGATTPPKLLEDPLLYKPAQRLDWTGRKFGPPPKQYRGLIGARTSRTRGARGSVAEYVAAAKAAGLDFIVFLEDWNDLSQKEWKSLAEACAQAREGGFIALPGVTVQDNFGGHWFCYGGPFDLPPAEYVTTVGGKKRFALFPPDQMTRRPYIGMHDWRRANQFRMRTGSWRHADAPWPYHSFRQYDAMAVVSAIGTRKLETVLEEYLHLQHRGECLHPVAVTIVSSPKTLARVLEAGAYWNVMNDQTIKNITGGKFFWQTNLRYLSNGPRIDDFRVLWHAVYAAGDWWRTDWYRCPLRVAASSDAGLKEVRLMDGQEVYRRWLPGGAKTFAQELTLCHDRQHELVLVVIDTKGQQAVSSVIPLRNYIGEEVMCADRVNQMGISMQRRPDGRIFKFNWSATPWKGNNNVVLFGDYPYGLDPIVGGGVRGIDGSRTSTSECNLSTGISSKAAGSVIYGPRFHRETDREVHSADLARGWGRTDGRFVLPKGERLRNVWWDLYPVKPADDYREWTQRTWFAVYPDMLAVEILERKLSVLKPLSLKRAPVTWHIGIAKAKGAPKLAIRSQGRLAYDGPIKTFGSHRSAYVDGLLEPGDYVAYYDGSVTNIAYMVYRGKLRFHADLRNGWVILEHTWDPKRTAIPAGTTVEYTLLSITAPILSDRWPADSLQFAELFRDRLGLDGDVPYRIRASRGKVVSTDYILVTEAEQGALVFQAEDVDLPAALPVEVRGLNANWSAGCGDLAGKRYRPIAVHEGKGFVALDPRVKKQHVFIGHPVMCDDPEIVLCCVPLDAKTWALEIHNPTERTRTVRVRASGGWPGLAFEPKTEKVEPGASVHLQLKSTAK